EARVTAADPAWDVEDPELSRAHLESLGDVVLALPLVVATTRATRADVRALAPGDALLVPELSPVDGRGALTGPASLVAPRSERGLACDLAGGGRLVLRGSLESHPWDPPMSADTTVTAQVL